MCIEYFIWKDNIQKQKCISASMDNLICCDWQNDQIGVGCLLTLSMLKKKALGMFCGGFSSEIQQSLSGQSKKEGQRDRGCPGIQVKHFEFLDCE